MELKDQIIGILTEQKHTYTELAEYIGMTEKDLDFALEHNSIDMRTLELVSRALHLSMYSFFRDKNSGVLNIEQYKNLNFWPPHEKELLLEIEKLRAEVSSLRNELAKKN